MNRVEHCHSWEEWDNYVLDNQGHPLQLWGWGEVKTNHGWHADRLIVLDESDKVIGGAQILRRKLPLPLRSLLYIPRGPFAKNNRHVEVLDALVEFAKNSYDAVALTIEPNLTEIELPTAWQKSDNKILPADTIVLDLTKTEAQLMGDMANKTRQYIRKSTKETTLQISTVKTRAELEDCLDLYHQTAERAGFQLHSDQYYRDVFEKMRDNSIIFATYVEDRVVAFLWLAASLEVAYELYGGVNEDGQNLRANYALKWHAIEKCREWGINRYDFGGLIDGGVSTFKKGWAESETKMVGTFDLPLSSYYSLWSRGLPLVKSMLQKAKRQFKRR